MKKIKKGDVVDIVAPASFSPIEEFEQGCFELNKWGLKVQSEIQFDAFHPYHSDEDEYRAGDLIRAFSNKDSKIIWSIRGGYGSIRLLEQLKKCKKPKNDKIFIGYSDLTSVHQFLNQEWNLKTIHGPMISSFSNSKFDQKCLLELKQILFGKKSSLKYKLSALNDFANKKTKIKGKLTGGNLSVIQTSLGTPYEMDFKNKIVLLEDVGERGYRLDRALAHLELSGKFKKAKAIILGDFVGGLESDGKSYVEFALTRFALKQKIPVYKSSEFGHGIKNRPLIFNHTHSITGMDLSTEINFL
jgi:muramoyltetrapeptide carboxypeptidase